MGRRSLVFQRFSPISNLNSLLFTSILVLAAALRFYCLSCSSLWHDEGNTWALMARSFADIAAAAAADIHPPGYYWLLKVWTALLGRDVLGLRSFSAVVALATVVLVYAIGSHIGRRRSPSSAALPRLAAFLAAVNPFQIYYSQEARMYSLLALESALLFWAVIAIAQCERQAAEFGHVQRGRFSWRYCIGPLVIYFFAAVAGLWTHYSFPAVLAAAGLAYLWDWFRRPTANATTASPLPFAKGPYLLRFVAVNVMALFVFLPWLPTAVARIIQWPAGGDRVTIAEGVRLTLQTLAVGPLRTGPELAWPWLLVVGGLPLLGIWALRRTMAGMALGLWLLAPILLMFGLGLFNDAFLKFLLIASPAWALLAASAFSQHLILLRLGLAPLLLLSAGLALVALPPYYASATARDNYAGIARTVAALGNPDQDLVVLNAPGQQEVWRYYDPGLPVLALPQQRPVDVAATEALLAASVAGRQQLFAIFWALDEADPAGVVESWLDRHAFKGLESWQGNVRFVRYSLAGDLACRRLQPAVHFDDFVQLAELCRRPGGWVVSSGDAVVLGLRWQALATTDRRYKVTLQLLDRRQQVIAQRDGEPGGGTAPTDMWRPGRIVEDNHALFIPPGTPPGDYTLILALYDGETGERLSVDGSDSFTVDQVTVIPGRPIPVEVVPMQHRVDRDLGPVRLLGYDAYRRGYAHAPQTPLAAGDLLHVTLYWQAPAPLPEAWPADLEMTLMLGDDSLRAPLAGGAYPTAGWTAGALVRGEFDLQYTGQQPSLSIQLGDQRLRLGQLPAQ